MPEGKYNPAQHGQAEKLLCPFIGFGLDDVFTPVFDYLAQLLARGPHPNDITSMRFG